MAKKYSTNDADFDKDFDEEFDKEFEKEFRQLERETAGLPKIIILVFITISVISLAIAIISAISNLSNLFKEESASGYVVDLVTRHDQTGSEFYYPIQNYRKNNGL